MLRTLALVMVNVLLAILVFSAVVCIGTSLGQDLVRRPFRHHDVHAPPDSNQAWALPAVGDP